VAEQADARDLKSRG